MARADASSEVNDIPCFKMAIPSALARPSFGWVAHSECTASMIMEVYRGFRIPAPNADTTALRSLVVTLR